MAELDLQPNEIASKFKKNKLLIPAIAIGVIAGLYFLTRGGSVGGNLDVGGGDEIVPPESDEAPEGSNGEDLSGVTDAIANLEENQAGILQSVAQALNDIGEYVSGAIGEQNQNLQQAIDSMNYAQGNDQPYDVDSGLLGQLFDFLPDVPNVLPPEMSGFYDDGYTSDGATFQYGNQVQEQIREAQQMVTEKLPSIKQTPVTLKSLTPTRIVNTVRQPVKQITTGAVRSINNATQFVKRTAIPSARGSIRTTFNAPNIRSSGGFGTNQQTVRTPLSNTAKTLLQQRVASVKAAVKPKVTAK